VPITTLIDLEAGTQIAHYFAGAAETVLLLANTGGFGLLARVATCWAATGRQGLPDAGRRANACCRRGWCCRPHQVACLAMTAGCWCLRWTS
jgi:hypothetical protein